MEEKKKKTILWSQFFLSPILSFRELDVAGQAHLARVTQWAITSLKCNFFSSLDFFLAPTLEIVTYSFKNYIL